MAKPVISRYTHPTFGGLESFRQAYEAELLRFGWEWESIHPFALARCWRNGFDLERTYIVHQLMLDGKIVRGSLLAFAVKRSARIYDERLARLEMILDPAPRQ